MAGKSPYNWDELFDKAKTLVQTGKVKPLTWQGLAAALDLPYSTLATGLRHRFGIKSVLDLVTDAGESGAVDQKAQSVERKNTLEVSGSAKLVYTLDELLDACQVDRSIWQVRDYVVNQWQYGTKDGVTYPLYQVKAWLVRKQLETVLPMIAPVELPETWAPGLPVTCGVRRALVIADPQVGFRRRLHTGQLVPFHDRRVLDLALQLVQTTQFDVIAFLGDCLDLAEWSSKFNPEAEFFWTTQPAIVEWAWWLRQFRQAAPNARLVEFEGNHDKRMRDLINTYMRAAYDLRPADEIELPPALSVERLLALHKIGVEYVGGYPEAKLWLNENVVLRHGDAVRSGPGDSAKAVVNKTNYTTVFGHVHRRELVSRKVLAREGHTVQTAFCPGTACHIDGRVPGSTEDDQWQQGLGIIEYTDDAESLLPVAIDGGQMIYNGQAYTARERDAEMDALLHAALCQTAGG